MDLTALKAKLTRLGILLDNAVAANVDGDAALTGAIYTAAWNTANGAVAALDAAVSAPGGGAG